MKALEILSGGEGWMCPRVSAAINTSRKTMVHRFFPPALRTVLTGVTRSGGATTVGRVTDPAHRLGASAPPKGACQYLQFNPVLSLVVKSVCILLTILVLSAFSASAQNSPPTAVGAQATTPEDTPLHGTLLGIPENAGLSFRIVVDGQHGHVQTSLGGAFTYFPKLNFSGQDKFTFVASDGTQDSAEATVIVTVTPENDKPEARAAALVVVPGSTVVGQLAGFDVDLDALTYERVAGATHGEVTVHPSGRFTYIPHDSNYRGTDSFTFLVKDSVLASEAAQVLLNFGGDSVGFLGDMKEGRLIRAQFSSDGAAPDVVPVDLTGGSSVSVRDQVVDTTNHRLYVLTSSGLKVYSISQTDGLTRLDAILTQSLAIQGTRLALSSDGRTAFVGGQGHVTAVNLYDEGVLDGNRSVTAAAFGNVRRFPFPDALKNRGVAAMGVHPAGDRLFVVIDMLPEHKKLGITNNLLRSDVGNGVSADQVVLPPDFGFLTSLEIRGDTVTADHGRAEPEFSTPRNIRYLGPGHTEVSIGIKSIAFSPDGNYALLSAVGAQTSRATAFGIMPTSDEGTGGILVVDVRSKTPNENWPHLGFIPTTEKGENTAELRAQIQKEGWRTAHPAVQWARLQYYSAAGAQALGSVTPYTAGPTTLNMMLAADTLAILEDSFQDYGYMQAYNNLYPRDMVGASSVAINHRGDFGVVTMQDTNNLGLLKLTPSDAINGYSMANRPDFFIATGTGKTINGFDAQLGSPSGQTVHSWAYPQDVAFTSDDSRIYIGMAGGLQRPNEPNKFGSANAHRLAAERDRSDGFFRGGNPPPGYSMYEAAGLRSPRIAATLQAFDSDNDLLSDQLEAYNRWNNLRAPNEAWRVKLVSTAADRITDPGRTNPGTSAVPDAFDVGYYLPPSGVGYRVNLFGMTPDTTNFATKGVVTTIEAMGREWNARFQEHEREVPSASPITRPYFMVGLLNQPGGGVIKNPTGEALKYHPSDGAQANFPYFSKYSDIPHDFIGSNNTDKPLDNSDEWDAGLDLENTEALIRLLLAQPLVRKIEVDPYLIDLIPGIDSDARIESRGRRFTSDRRDLDTHMFVTFSSLSVDMDIDSDNSGTLDESRDEDMIEDQPGRGKFIAVNSGDRDSDGTPDYADFDTRTLPDGKPVEGNQFTRIVIRFPGDLDPTTTKFRLIYSASDPLAITVSSGPPKQYHLPSSGVFRVWVKDGNADRNANDMADGGDFIASDKLYSVQLLLNRAQSSPNNRAAEVYIEAVKPALTASEQDIVVEVVPAVGPESSVAALADAITVVSAQALLMVDTNRDGVITHPSENASDTTSAERPYRFWINDDDDWEAALGNDTPGQLESVSGTFLGNEADFSTMGTGMGNVNGPRDLVDYFPVYLDIKSMLQTMPPSDAIRYRIKQADAALNFVYTNLTRDGAASIQTVPKNAGFGPELTQAPSIARKWHVTAAGVDLFDPSSETGSPAFLNAILHQDGGVILVEGRAATTAPLVLSVEKDGLEIVQVALDIRISPVEQMFRHVNLTEGVQEYEMFGSGSYISPPLPGLTTNTAEPVDYPDSLTNGKYFVFIHGFNVDASAARGWNAEVFKRLHVFGSKARFVGVQWNGSPPLPPPLAWVMPRKYLDYHKAVFQAFQTGDLLARALSFTDGADVTVAAHSLGNVVTSHAIQSGGFTPTRYFMINAAAAIEAYSIADAGGQFDMMRHNKWVSYQPKLYAAKWHELFAANPADNRNGLTWKNRFASVRNRTILHTFYSEEEEVLADGDQIDSASLLELALEGDLDEVATGEYSWKLQELVKGNFLTSSASGGVIERRQGGWEFNRNWDEIYTDPMDSKTKFRRMSPADAAQLTDDQLKTEPFFRRFLESDLMSSDPAIASAKAGERKVLYDVLARAIPAMSNAVAANRMASLGANNYDMPRQARPNGWHDSSNRWRHSDFRDVALIYVYPMYEEMIFRGGLDQ